MSAPRQSSEEAAQALPERIDLRVVFGLSWPIMVSMLAYTAMSVIDTAFVARLGTAPVAGIGLAIPIVFLFQCFGIGLLIGAKVAIAQRTGAGDEERARRIAWQGLYLAVFMGILVSTLAGLGAGFFELLGASHRVADEAAAFFSIRTLAAPIVFANFAAVAWFQGRGDMRTPMVASVSGNVVNIVLDPVLIFGLGPLEPLGVAGAALSTLVGLGLATAWLWWRLLPAIRDTPREPAPALLREIWHLGLPIGVRQTLGVGSFAVFTALLARVGAVDLAAHVVAFRVVSVSFLPGHAVSEAAGVLVGQAVGARRPDLARAAWRTAVKLGVGIMGAWAVVFLAVPGLLVSPFGVGPEVAELAVLLLGVAALFQVADAVAMVGLGALNGAGDTRFGMVACVGAAWGVNVPLALLATSVFDGGAVGAWLALTAEVTVLAVLAWRRLQGSAWLEHGLVDDGPRGKGAREAPAEAAAGDTAATAQEAAAK